MALTFFYPGNQQVLFTNREFHLGLLDLARESLLAGQSRHLAFLGPRRLGKTLLMKEFIQRTLGKEGIVPVYLDCQRAPLTPESFSVYYTGTILFWLLRRGKGRASAFRDISFQIKEAATLGPEIADYFYDLDRALKTTPIDQRLLLDQAFELPEFLAQTLDQRFMIFIDEFPELLQLSNYPQIGQVTELLRAVLQTQDATAYVAAGSAIGMMQAIFYDAASPLAVHFRAETLPPFTREDSYILIEKHLRDAFDSISEGIKLTIHRWSYGHPFYIGAICERLIELTRLQGAPLSAETIKQAFVLETLWQNGRLANLCRFTLEKSLERARGQSQLQLILQIVAVEDSGLTLSALASELKRSTGQTRTLLHRLMEVDLITQDGDLYDFRDPVMKLWAAYYYQGIELPVIPRQQVLSQLVTEVSQRYQRISSQLGLARKSQVRELIAAFDGQEVPGKLFGGHDHTVRLPTWKLVAPHQTPDGQLELDVVASGDVVWVAEIKWKKQPARRADLERFQAKVQTTNLPQPAVKAPATPTLWFIARAGFRESALRYARQEGILTSSEQDLQALAEKLGIRFTK